MSKVRRPPKLPFAPLNDLQHCALPGVDVKVTQYGDYDRQTGEYLIHRPDTPQPWYNYLTNGRFTGYVSNTGGGTCFCDDAQNRRILRTHIHNRPVDQPGRWIYIRDRKSGRYWSATWAPTHNDLKQYKYQCRVGAGYTTISSVYNGIATTVTYFVPPQADCEIWRFEIMNRSKTDRLLDVFPYCEFMLWSQERDENLDAGFKCTDITCDDSVIIHRSMYDFPGTGGGWRRQYACFGSSATPRTFDVLMDAFVGPHNGYAAPAAVVNGKCSNYVNRSGQPCAAMQLPVRLPPGKTRRFNFVLGYAARQRAAKALAHKCAKDKWVLNQFARLRAAWQRHLAKFQAATGQAAFDVPFNYFAPVQSATTLLLSRSISPYQLSGSRGLGFRDSNQDTLGAVAHQPQKVRELITLLLGVVRPAGDACHKFYPAQGTGMEQGYWDDHLWCALAVGRYVRETGDLEFLGKVLPYWQSRRRGTVLEHLERAARFAERRSGKNGLPLLGEADWNDCLNAYPGAESVFTACLYCHAVREMGAMYEALGDGRNARRMELKHRAMARRINRRCWDGRWYTRLILADGSTVGSSKNRYGKIFIESNVWAVTSGVARGQRARTALDSARKYLGTPYGFRLCVPPYPDYDPTVGSISVFPPGMKENGSIFCHTNPWLVCAEAAIGRGRLAYDAFVRLSPYTKNRIQSYHCGEPYVVSQMITMPPNKQAGRARNAWLTGTASWFYVCMAEAILGVKPDYPGLRIDPCVPGWKSFGIQREFRGTKYDIRVNNPQGIERGVRSVTINGKKIRGNLIPIMPPRRSVKVEVLMGARR